jgi:SP family xylose:H+ symportor-like MFS transporter
MMTEIYPAPIRGQAMSLAVASQWIANLLVSGTFPLLLGNDTLNAAWNHGFPFWLYGSFGIIAAFIVLRYVPRPAAWTAEHSRRCARRRNRRIIGDLG